jgi:hypothetical protein
MAMLDLLTDTSNLPKIAFFPPAIVDLASTGQRAPRQLITHGTLCPILAVHKSQKLFSVYLVKERSSLGREMPAISIYIREKSPSLNF